MPRTPPIVRTVGGVFCYHARPRGAASYHQRAGQPLHSPAYSAHSRTEAGIDELRVRLEQALAGTYTFQRELGGGGMSRTYLALEQSLNRRLVVKVLGPERPPGISFGRFHRKVLLAAQPQHPHFVPVLSAGE